MSIIVFWSTWCITYDMDHGKAKMIIINYTSHISEMSDLKVMVGQLIFLTYIRTEGQQGPSPAQKYQIWKWAQKLNKKYCPAMENLVVSMRSDMCPCWPSCEKINSENELRKVYCNCPCWWKVWKCALAAITVTKLGLFLWKSAHKIVP